MLGKTTVVTCEGEKEVKDDKVKDGDRVASRARYGSPGTTRGEFLSLYFSFMISALKLV